METTPKLYYLGEKEDSFLVKGCQGQLSQEGFGGDARGKNSTDFQLVRESSDRVASGENSFIGAGQNNRVLGSDSFAAAGLNNELTGDMGFVAGESNSVSGTHGAAFGNINDVLGNFSIASGTGHVITGDAASAEGDGNIVSGYAAHAEGGLNICDGQYSHAEGLAARAYNDYQHARASGGFSNPGEIGEAQYTNIIARLSADDNYPLNLIVGEDKQIVLMNNKLNAFRIMIVASSQIAMNVMDVMACAWEIKGLIGKADTPESVRIIGTLGKTLIGGTDPGWDVNVSADTVNGALRITASAESGVMIRWVAFVEMIEVAFYS